MPRKPIPFNGSVTMRTFRFSLILISLLFIALLPIAVSADTTGTNTTSADTNSTVSANVTTVATTESVASWGGTDGVIAIMIRGSTDFNIGDRIYFDGTSNASQSLVLKMVGPGLPSEGVPLDNPSGTAGSGSLVTVGSNHKWTYAWDTNLLSNTSVQTAKYTIYAVDLANPTVSTKTAVMIHKRTLAFTLSPNPVPVGQTITLAGSTTADVTQIRFDMVRVPELSNVRSSVGYDILLAADGSFTKQFHADLPEGTYVATVKTPDGSLSATQTYVIGLNQTASVETAVATPVVTETTVAATEIPTTIATTVAQSQVPTTGVSNTTLYIVIGVLVIVIIIGAVLFLHSKKSAPKATQEKTSSETTTDEEEE